MQSQSSWFLAVPDYQALDLGIVLFCSVRGLIIFCRDIHEYNVKVVADGIGGEKGERRKGLDAKLSRVHSYLGIISQLSNQDRYQYASPTLYTCVGYLFSLIVRALVCTEVQVSDLSTTLSTRYIFTS